MTNLFDEPSRRCLKVDAWPPADRRAWQIMLREGHVLDNPGLVSHWSPATRHKNRRGYGRWLTFVSSEGGIDRSRHPADRVTRHALRQYLRLLQEQRLAPYTVVARIDELRAVISAMAPDRGWQWLIDLVTRLRRQAKPATNKRTRLVPSVDLFHWGVCCMDTVETDDDSDPCLSVVRYRDGLMIALLATRPLRLSNMASIRIGHHLVRHGQSWLLVFEAHEVKNRRPLELPFPDALSPYLDRYLEHWRPLLVGGQELDRLWVTQYGRPMNGKAVHRRITKVTKRAFGWPLNPHLFRDCAATFVAIEDPEHVRISAPLLGHTNLSTTERYYNQAQSLEAGRLFHEVIATRRREVRRSKHSK